MKTDHTFLEIPLEFRMACVICDFPVHKALQSFIDHISLYQSLSNEFYGCYSLATNALLSHALRNRRGPSSPFIQQRQQSIKYLGALISLVAAEDPPELIKRKESKEIVNKIYKAICPYASFKDQIQLDHTHFLKFTPDFSVLCELHNYEPKEILENFMKDISLAESTARSRLKMEDDNMAMAFFMELSDGHRKLAGIIPYPDLFTNFADRIEELQRSTFITMDLPYVIKRYQEVYSDLYQQIIIRLQRQ